MTSTAPPSGPTSTEDLAGLRTAWAAAADDADASAVAERLLAAAGSASGTAAGTAPGTGSDEHRWHRARLLLGLGRPEDALALLEDADRARLVTDKPRGWADVVALACWTAQGDADARAALLRFGATLPPSHAPVHAEIVAAAGRYAGDLTLADDAALAMPARRTPSSVRHRVVAHLVRRSSTDPGRAAATVVDTALALLELDPPADQDTTPVVQVVEDLAVRGDVAGAALLVDALADLRPGSPGLGALRRRLALRRSWVSTAAPALTAVLGCVAIVTAAVLLHLPALVVTASVPAWLIGSLRVRPRGYPQLTAVDERALGLVRRQTLRVFPNRAAQVGAVLLGAAAGAALALLLSVVVSEAVAPGVELGESTVLDLSVLATVLAGTVLTPVGLVRLRRRGLLRRAAKAGAAARAAELVDLARCACWQLPHARGQVADGYAAQHLVPGDPAALRGLDLPGPAAPEVRVCPTTGLRWLLVREPGEPHPVLLRGTAPGPVVFAEEAGTGGYL